MAEDGRPTGDRCTCMPVAGDGCAEHGDRCAPLVADAACPDHGMKAFLGQLFEALEEPTDG